MESKIAQEAYPFPRGSALISPLMEALHGRKVTWIDRPEKGNPVTAYMLLHQRFARGMDVAIKLIEEDEKRRKSEGFDKNTTGNPLFALDALQDAIYKAAELFEFYEKDFLYFLGLKSSSLLKKEREEYSTAIKQLKLVWSTLCNKCKHNHAFLLPIEGIYDSGEWISGFTLVRRNGDRITPEDAIHKDIQIFSFNWTLRAVLRDVIIADHVAATLVSRMKDTATSAPIDTVGISLPYLEVISKAMQRSRLAMPKENLANLEDVYFENREIVIGRQSPIPVGTGNFNMRVILNIISNQLKVRFPYVDADLKVGIGFNKPLGGLMRITVGPIVVPAAAYSK